MERTMISWNFPNWITVGLMAASAYLVLGAVAQLLKQVQQQRGVAGG